MEFEFQAFSTRSFERFSQDLAVNILGPGIMVFGDGPDGAREATYDGTLDFPSETDKWSGYTIMQAKFLQSPGTAGDDADWLVKQLTNELNKFIDKDSDLRKPQYYILVTNAKLSPVPATKRGKGGLEKIDAVFAKFAPQLGLKGFRVWHRDQLTTLLSNAPELRKSYAAWVTTSDVIAALMDSIQAEASSFKEAIYRYLQRELRTQRPTRLQQAGHGGDTLTMLEDVFVDLPFSQDHSELFEQEDKFLLKEILFRSLDRLDGESIAAQGYGKGVSRPDRILLLGGPGQGKSTISQYLAQIFRANILRSDKTDNLPVDIIEIIDSIFSKTEALDLPIALPRRMPFRVDLPSFADDLSKATSKQERFSLIGYLTQQVSNISDTSIDIENLRQWLNEYPAILILDGLDEVPPTSNRSEVIKSINEFWDEVARADILMLVTTRPQGYNDDLDPALYTKLEMSPLTPEHALKYARKLADTRELDLEQRARVMTRFEEASKSPMTSRLMVSPLQVAILLALIDQRGDAPSDRWTLFHKYFTVLLEREQGKTGPTGETIRVWSRIISAIHQKAGFFLHLEAETKGSSDAHLTYAELEKLIRGQLEDEGYEDDELLRITKQLLMAATDRLVLLVQREDQKYSFEVRSLQEFMSAAYLMTGREAAVQARLRHISNRNHWRHVFLIAASKCFSTNDTEHFRDTIVTICQELNESDDEIDANIKSGSDLAIDLLEDGLAYDQPKYRRLLQITAIDIVYAGPSALPVSFKKNYTQELERNIGKLRLLIQSADVWVRIATWRLLLRQAAIEEPWAEALVEEFWSEFPQQQIQLLLLNVSIFSGSRIAKLFIELIENVKLDILAKSLHTYLKNNSQLDFRALFTLFPFFELFGRVEDNSKFIGIDLGSGSVPVSLEVISIEAGKNIKDIYQSIPKTESWSAIRSLADFHEAPSCDGLVDLLEQIEKQDWFPVLILLRSNLPWPLATALDLVQQGEELSTIIQLVREGGFGDIQSWKDAELRWKREGLKSEDFEVCTHGIYFDASVGAIGMPLFSRMSMTHEVDSDGYDANWIDKLIKLTLNSSGPPKRRLLQILRFALSLYSPKRPLEEDEVCGIISQENTVEFFDDWYDLSLIAEMSDSTLSSATVLRELDKLGQSGRVFYSSKNIRAASKIIYKHITNYPGLLPILSSVDPEFANLWWEKVELQELKSHRAGPVRDCAFALNIMAGREEAGEIVHLATATSSRVTIKYLHNIITEEE